MDGASRFTQRDAVASILITGINIIAGFLIGVFQHGMDSAATRCETYTVLTIGDGLVTVIPALMISISGGLIVTRASSEERLGAAFRQAVLRQRAAADAGERRMILLWRMFPGTAQDSLPAARRRGRDHRHGGCARSGLPKNRRRPPTATEAKENMEGLLKVDPLAVEMGIGLVKICQAGPDSPLSKRIDGIRKQLATEPGILPAAGALHRRTIWR